MTGSKPERKPIDLGLFSVKRVKARSVRTEEKKSANTKIKERDGVAHMKVVE